MSNDRLRRTVMNLGGGGASAPSTHNTPLLAPGLYRPDWPKPAYAKLPWQRKLERVTYYADTLLIFDLKEPAPAFQAIIDCLEDYTQNGKLDDWKLDTALVRFGHERTHNTYWTLSLECKIKPEYEIPNVFSKDDAAIILEKLSHLVG